MRCFGVQSISLAHLVAVIEKVLKQRILDVKNEKGVYVTLTFPKLVYVLDSKAKSYFV